MRLAYFTPLPPSKSGIADYNSELLPYLANGAEFSVIVCRVKPNGSTRRARERPHPSLTEDGGPDRKDPADIQNQTR